MIMKRIFLLTAVLGLSSAIGISTNALAQDVPAQASSASAEELSTHKTEAVFEGIQQTKCMGRTALCPDRCGHAKEVAVFKILKYLDYQKPGEYGDEKQKKYFMDLKAEKFDGYDQTEWIKIANELKPGQVVDLNWEHLYMKKGGNQFPIRVVSELKPKMAADGKPVTEKVEELPPLPQPRGRR